MNEPPATTAPTLRRRYRRALWVLVLGTIGAGLYYSNGLAGRLQGALEWVSHAGFLGMISYVGIYIVASVFMFPGSVLTIGAGTVFGLAKGVLLTSIGSTLGATAAFLVGRYLARDWVARRIARSPGFKAIDQAVAREGWKIVGLTRLSPVFPFGVLNYGYGITSVSLRHYLLASWLGMLPATVLYVYIGSLLREAATVTAQTQRTRSPVEWTLYGIGLLATVVVTVFVTRLARRALGQMANDKWQMTNDK